MVEKGLLKKKNAWSAVVYPDGQTKTMEYVYYYISGKWRIVARLGLLFLFPLTALLLGTETLSLTAYQLLVVEVVDLHGPAHFVHRLDSRLAGLLRSLL